METRVKELERKVEVMTRALFKLSEWMDGVDDIHEIDETLFDDLDKRILRIEKLNIMVVR